MANTAILHLITVTIKFISLKVIKQSYMKQRNLEEEEVQKGVEKQETETKSIK